MFHDVSKAIALHVAQESEELRTDYAILRRLVTGGAVIKDVDKAISEYRARPEIQAHLKSRISQITQLIENLAQRDAQVILAMLKKFQHPDEFEN